MIAPRGEKDRFKVQSDTLEIIFIQEVRSILAATAPCKILPSYSTQQFEGSLSADVHAGKTNGRGGCGHHNPYKVRPERTKES